MKLTIYRKVILITYTLTVVGLSVFKFPYYNANVIKRHNIFFSPIEKVAIKDERTRRRSLTTGKQLPPENREYYRYFKYNYKLWLTEIFLITLIYGTIFIILPNENRTY